MSFERAVGFSAVEIDEPPAAIDSDLQSISERANNNNNRSNIEILDDIIDDSNSSNNNNSNNNKEREDDPTEKHQLDFSEFADKAEEIMNLSPPKGVSFRDEFDRLPDFTAGKRTLSPSAPAGLRLLRQPDQTPVMVLMGSEEDRRHSAPFCNTTLPNIVGKDVPLYIGTSPDSDEDYIEFWSAVNRLNICGIVTVNLLRDQDDEEAEEEVKKVLPWPSRVGYECRVGKVTTATLEHEKFRAFQTHLIDTNGRNIPTWSFHLWPPNKSVPVLPHNFLDFLRCIIQQSYAVNGKIQPILIIDRHGLDVAGLTSAAIMLLYQACQQRRADVWRCVAELRSACRYNVVSKFGMYEFLYDCLLQIMCATPTIMSGDFRRAFRHLLRRGPPLTGNMRRVAPILEQYELVTNLAGMYRSRVFAVGKGRRNQFEPRTFKDVKYFNFPSFAHSKHFVAIRGVVHVNHLLDLMAKRKSRTLLWFSETPRPDEILTGNQHDGILIGEVSAFGVFYTYEMEAPTQTRGPWRVTVVQFVGWPAISGERPLRPCRELIITLRRVIEHADAVAQSFQESDGEVTRPVVTLYEADAGNCTWRSAMAVIAAALDQRMSKFLEVDIFRTCQFYKIFEPETIIISPKQYTWCFKLAWSSYSMAKSEGRVLKASPRSASNVQHLESSPLSSARLAEALENPYDGSDQFLYTFPSLQTRVPMSFNKEALALSVSDFDSSDR